MKNERKVVLALLLLSVASFAMGTTGPVEAAPDVWFSIFVASTMLFFVLWPFYGPWFLQERAAEYEEVGPRMSSVITVVLLLIIFCAVYGYGPVDGVPVWAWKYPIIVLLPLTLATILMYVSVKLYSKHGRYKRH